MIQPEPTTRLSPQAPDRLWSLKAVEGYKISATDGDIGHVHDFFFDDQSWQVRYLVADTRHWLPGRKVLLPTPMLIGPDVRGKMFAVSLTCEKVKTSPDVDTDKPVSRIRELELHTHYDWPFHWGMVGAWMGSVPPVPPIEPPPVVGDEDGEGSHLRSVREMTGYKVEAADGEAGVVDDFVADDQMWTVRYLIVLGSPHFPRRKVAVMPDCLAGPISWLEHKVKLKLTLADIGNLPEWNSPRGPAAWPVNPMTL